MNEFTISVGLNIFLISALVFVVVKAKLRMVEEKVATFVGCIGAVTNGIAHDLVDDRARMTVLGFSNLGSERNIDELQERLTRAGYFCLLRNEPTLADVGGEYVRELTLRAITQTQKDDSDSEAIWAYITGVADGIVAFEQEPNVRFGNQALAKAQYSIEAEFLALYRSAVEASPPKLFS
jgi:hypothetical protein